MEKVMLKVFTLAAAVVASHLIVLNTKAVQVKQIEELSVEERAAMKDLTERMVYAPPKVPIKL